MKSFNISLALLMTDIGLSFGQPIDYKGFPQWSWHKKSRTEYYLYVPSGAKPGTRYPLAIFLHGCCGEDDHATLRNAVDPPARMWHDLGANTQRIPTFIMAPKTTRSWAQKLEDIKNIADSLVNAGVVDPRRIYMTGFSMGAAGTWQFLEKYPGYLAAAIPMGMGIRADLNAIKNTPIWTIRGEHDYFSQKLDSQAAVLRILNGDDRGALEWETGVNPVFTSFKGLGHGIQWDAVSSLDLTDWAYSKINDGNIYPVIYFSSPGYKQVFPAGSTVNVIIQAHDPDGVIKNIELRVNHRKESTFTSSPVKTSVRIMEGDNLLEAVARDNGGKISTTRIIIRTDTKPILTTCEMPDGQAGSFYFKELFGSGNEPITFHIAPESELPNGLVLSQGNIIRGIPEWPGDYPVKIIASDEDGDTTSQRFNLHIREKGPSEVIVTHVHSVSDTLQNVVSEMMTGELPNQENGTEVFFSEPGPYTGLTYISTSAKQANIEGDNILGFHVDQDVTLYVAYEKLDQLFTSSIPEWLRSFMKSEGPQIVAQYHYFDVYQKDFPAGDISLPGGESAKNNVICNYFVMIGRKGIMPDTQPEITTHKVPPIKPGVEFKERFTSLGGEGKLNWGIRSGNLPEGLNLSDEGLISGVTFAGGVYRFTVFATDAQGDQTEATWMIRLNRKNGSLFKRIE